LGPKCFLPENEGKHFFAPIINNIVGKKTFASKFFKRRIFYISRSQRERENQK
jgi:hypothetical protein